MTSRTKRKSPWCFATPFCLARTVDRARRKEYTELYKMLFTGRLDEGSAMGPDVTLIPNMMQATSAASSYVQSFTEAIFSRTGSALQVPSIIEKRR